jgi:5-methylcytosine-specific restriction endonuclease McrA
MQTIEEKREKHRIRQRVWRANNRDKCRASYKKWLDKNKDKAKEATLRWREEHKEKNLADQRVRIKRWGERHPERVLEKTRSYRRRNPSWNNEQNRKYRNRKIGSQGFHTASQWEELKKNVGYMCLCCKRNEPEIKLTEDHIIPLSRGGTDDISNIQPLCQSCNSRKHVKTINFLIISAQFSTAPPTGGVESLATNQVANVQ